MQAGFDVVDLSLERSVADIFERPVTEDSLDVFAANAAHAPAKIIAELDHVPSEDRRDVIFRFRFTFDEAAQALPGVARKVGLADFAIVDDIEAASQLFLNHFGNRLAHPLSES